MMTRIEFHNLLKNISGINNVYYQPPENIKIHYPCIIYNFDNYQNSSADNGKYLKHKRYSVTIISKDPDNDYVEKVLTLPLSSFDRRMVVDNLYHDVLTIYV
ncbi:hypothetical protein BO224_06855 [Erysipelotrichaceae bacterium NYU-BL-E8]|uniref:Uncharacterized protein n=1 Tax=Ileibacterium valens TaxID=1862668 RepID=A0A1U7NHK2_9FIRM|nr:hypothetical protein BO224_06855 [Erysipelotrichaceae bacterium NYU-BL-E8]OLU39982.1 hypothetical protein BM735_06465 [Erysipelotrichaceae bacterium NYU-BL-F16]OLU41309.1 hypothetical protein BO222_03555 [Ileibacterium valens]